MTKQKSVSTITYPRRDALAHSSFTLDKFNRLTAYLMSWRQGPGVFGGLHLHACWSESSVLSRRYHGQTTFIAYAILEGALRMADVSGDASWRKLAGEIVEGLMALQAPEGGFIHANYQLEPAEDCEETCPIHQGLPLLGMLSYAAKSYADAALRSRVRETIDRHWQWFNDYGWKRGRFWGKGKTVERLTLPGWCGVTNQDLVIVGALARYGKVFGDWNRYERWGKPVLDAYLSSHYYHERIGLFERGDRPNFAERTRYNAVILEMFHLLNEQVGDDPRLPAVIENVTRHLCDARTIGPDGLTHMRWGAETDAHDKSRVIRWIDKPFGVSDYPELIAVLERSSDTKCRALADDLRRTLAAYTFADGTTTCVACGDDPLFAIMPNSTIAIFWRWLMDQLGDEVKRAAPVALPVVHRRCRDLLWKSGPTFWAIERDGKRLFAGTKSQPTGISIGETEPPPAGCNDELNRAEIEEIVAGDYSGPPALK